MPSFDDVIDHTDDELLTPDIVSQSKSRESSEEPIRFEPGHFDNSSGSEEETVSDENYNAAQSNPAQTLAESLMANALKQMVGSALQNLAGMTAPAKETKSRSQRDRVAYTHGDSDDEVVFDNVDDGSIDRKEPRTKSLDSEEINIEEEFEFLDEYELEEDKSWEDLKIINFLDQYGFDFFYLVTSTLISTDEHSALCWWLNVCVEAYNKYHEKAWDTLQASR